MMNELMITMSQADFADFVRDRHKLTVLENALYNAAELNYSGTMLDFDNKKICPVLEALDYEEYNSVLHQLQDDKRKSDVGQPMN